MAYSQLPLSPFSLSSVETVSPSLDIGPGPNSSSASPEGNTFTPPAPRGEFCEVRGGGLNRASGLGEQLLGG